MLFRNLWNIDKCSFYVCIIRYDNKFAHDDGLFFSFSHDFLNIVHIFRPYFPNN